MYIKNPSDKLKMLAINQNGLVIYYIHELSEEMKIAAVNQNGCAIFYIDNPSREVQLAAIWNADKKYINIKLELPKQYYIWKHNGITSDEKYIEKNLKNKTKKYIDIKIKFDDFF